MIKAGRTEAAGKAAASHTGSLTGSDEVLDAAFSRSGVLRVDEISELFGMAEVLGKQPRPKGPRLTILTNAGGPARARDGRPYRQRRRARRDIRGDDGSSERLPPRPLEPRQPYRRARRRRPRTLREDAGDRGWRP